MKEIRPVQKHLLSLPPCPGCGGYRYLVARTRSRKNIELQVKCIGKREVRRVTDKLGTTPSSIHHEASGSLSQTYKTVASIPYSLLDPHDKGNKASRDGDSPVSAEHETLLDILAVIAKHQKKGGLVTNE